MQNKKIRISNAKLVLADEIVKGAYILVDDGKIVDFGRDCCAKIWESSADEIYDAGGAYVSAGFIDMHTHGAGNADFMDCSVEACQKISLTHAKYGTTLLYPTTLASDKAELLEFFKVYKEAKNNLQGAVFGGLHLEGPYFSYNFRGAQDPKYLRNPEPSEYLEILSACPDIKRWSIAPELPNALEFARELRRRAILPSIAHTDAIYEDVVEAFESGFTLMTHFYSCMNGVTRRNAFRCAGCVEAAYLIDEMDVEIIADGAHLPKALLQLIVKIKGTDHVALVTDSMRGAGLTGVKDIILGSLKNGQPAIIEDGVAKLPDRSAFAGSVATADRLVRTMYKTAQCSLCDSVKMMTATPARIMGAEKKGRIAKGFDADLAIFDDDINIKKTMINGKFIGE